MSEPNKLQVMDMLESLHQYLSEKDWESSEKVADAIQKRVEALKAKVKGLKSELVFIHILISIRLY